MRFLEAYKITLVLLLLPMPPILQNAEVCEFAHILSSTSDSINASTHTHKAETEIANICPLHQVSFIFLRFVYNFHIAVRSFCTSNVVHLIFVIVFLFPFQFDFHCSVVRLLVHSFGSIHSVLPHTLPNFCGFILSNFNHSHRTWSQVVSLLRTSN